MYDIAIIGGGVNGCGIARDAAGRGLSVFLAEKGDLAGGTSSASTKLIHGGLRYLEHYAFRLVRESLSEREVLLRMAPHIIRPLRFVLPHHRALRPALLIRLGLFLYDHLGGREILPASRAIDLARACRPASRSSRATPAASNTRTAGWMTRASSFSMPWTPRVAAPTSACAPRSCPRGAAAAIGSSSVSNARSGRARDDRGACAGQCRRPLDLRGDDAPGRHRRALGVQAREGQPHRRAKTLRPRLRLHLPECRPAHRLRDTLRAGVHPDRHDRCRFRRGCRPRRRVGRRRSTYLCRAASEYFVRAVAPSDVVWAYAGVRPLYDEGDVSAQEATRDFVLELEGRRASRRCSTSSAARSPRSGISPRRH